jgi:aspartyl-tRNA(Asn)/glutamyl-tRNA(Gln) amidotransferase subunit A
MDLADWPAFRLLEAYARKSASPVDVAKAVIARIEAYEPQLQALYAFAPEAALTAARESEQRWLQGEARALDGIPAFLWWRCSP